MFGEQTAEILFEIITECMDDYLYIFDLQKNTFEISQSAVKRFNMSKNVLTDAANEVMKVVYEEDRRMLAKHLADICEGRENVHNLHYRWLDKDGMPVWINCRGIVIIDQQGNTRLGSYSLVQGGCRFIKDIPPYIVAAHEPIAFYSINTKVLEIAGFSETLIKHIAQAYRILYKANTSQHDALLRIKEQVPPSAEINRIVEFVETSKLGIIH